MAAKTEDRYILITSELLFNNQLSSSHKILCAFVLGLSANNSYCYATNSHIAQLMGLSVGRVSNIINDLVKGGYIEREVIRNERKQIIERRLRVKDGKLKIPVNNEVEIIKNEPVKTLNGVQNDPPIHEKVDTPLPTKTCIPPH
ncbi:MAG: hypothetical protein C4308_14930, partial [Chitinophagaceae bacterium]